MHSYIHTDIIYCVYSVYIYTPIFRWLLFIIMIMTVIVFASMVGVGFEGFQVVSIFASDTRQLQTDFASRYCQKLYRPDPESPIPLN